MSTNVSESKRNDSLPQLSESSNVELVGAESRKESESSSKVSPADQEKKREGFSNPIEFVLTSLGLAVGLGNIWRFPTRAYENGGSAFLIPYVSCAILFGLPALYLEFVAGQYQGRSPPVIFRRIMPILEGIGFMGPIVSGTVAVYYIVIISWIVLYMLAIFRGHSSVWTRCDNAWNDPHTCIDMVSQRLCQSDAPPGWNMSTPLPEKFVYVEGKCQDASLFDNVTLVSATEQYFTINILNPSPTMLDLGGINWHILISMTFCWILTGLLILKGMKLMGKISYVTVVVPYILVVVLFVRGVTLDGSSDGLRYYLGRPDFSKVFTYKAWSEALKQLCFSLSVGHGALMSMASYNNKKSSCFKNAAFIIIADTMMSLVGGAAVFSTLGFLAKQRNVTVPEVVNSGLSLAFVVYPEAMSQMPVSAVWSFIFFAMLFLLGVSTEIAYVEAFCSCLYDQIKYFREHRWVAVCLWCTLLYTIGVIFSTRAGLYWFEMFDEYSAGFSAVITVLLESIVFMYIYGGKHFFEDIKEIHGEPTKISRVVGAHSPFFIWNWRIVTPLSGVILIVFALLRDYPFNGDPYKYPIVFDIVGWTLGFLPLTLIAIFAYLNYRRAIKDGLPLATLFTLQKQHVSFARISADYSEEKLKIVEQLPDNEPWTVDPVNESLK